jgi:hypothetical protein
MKPGSLVVYIGGQSDYDVQLGYGLDKGAIYEVMNKGTRTINGRKLSCVELVEMPDVSHLTKKFREVQPPDSVDMEELLKEPEAVY